VIELVPDLLEEGIVSGAFDVDTCLQVRTEATLGEISAADDRLSLGAGLEVEDLGWKQPGRFFATKAFGMSTKRSMRSGSVAQKSTPRRTDSNLALFARSVSASGMMLPQATAVEIRSCLSKVG
jgi:hypothetical protein